MPILIETIHNNIALHLGIFVFMSITEYNYYYIIMNYNSVLECHIDILW